MKAVFAGLGLALLAGAAQAGQCYSRVYSDDHMAKNPDQVVQALTMSFYTDGALGALVSARFRDDDMVYRAEFSCAEPPWVDEGVWLCTGGNFFMAKGYGTDALLVYTDGGFVVNGPAGTEPRWVIDDNTTESTFKLSKASAEACD